MKKFTLKGLLIVLLSLCSLATHAYDCVNSGVYFKYIKKDGSYYKYSDNLWSMEVTYKTTSYNSYSGSVHVPQRDYSSSQVRYYYPLGIGENAFRNSTGLTDVTFEDEPRIAYVRDYGFYNCTSLTSVSLSRSQLMVIGNYAFYNCSSLTDDGISFPSTLDSIGNYAFYGCSSLTKIDLSDTKVTSIGDYAFTYCTNLKEVILPSTVTSIGAHAFGGCGELTTVTIPTSVTNIGAYAFNVCPKLTTVNNFSDLPITEITNYLFYDCPSLPSITIPSEVTSIGTCAFEGTGITEIDIPSKVTSIGEYAFRDCTSLTKVNYDAANCTSAGSSTKPPFYGCTAIASVTFGEGVKTIPQCLFEGHYSSYFPNLTSIEIPSSVENLGDYAFASCTSLTDVVFNATKCTVFGNPSGYPPFSGCTALANVTIGSNVTTIPAYLFCKCSGLTAIEIPSSVTSIGYEPFGGCTSLTDVVYNAVNCTSAGSSDYPPFYGSTALTNVTIGDEVTTIPDYLFDGHYSDYFPKLTSITIPSNITSIGDCSFYDCQYLTSVTMNSAVLTSIDNSAFESCKSLKSINLPSTLTSLGGWVFKDCSALTQVYSFANTPPTCNLNEETFRSVSSSCVLYVPAGSETAYGGYSGTYTWSSLSAVRTFHLLDVVAKADPEVQGNDEGYGYLTYYNGDYTYTLPEGMTATTVSGMDDNGSLIMNWEYNGDDPDKAEVPAKTAVVLYGKVDEFMAMVDYDSSDTSKYGTIEDGTAPETNWLHGVWSTDDLYSDNNYTSVVFAYDEDDEKTIDNYLFYTLNYDGIDDETGVYKDIGFYWSAEDGGPFSIAAKKAWLAIPTDAANGAKFSTFLFGDNGETTGIKAINNTSSDDVRTGDGYIYNLAGQRVNDMNRRGIYIVNGRKVVKK